MPHTCKSCNTDVDLHYCPNCGRPSALTRIDGRYLLHEIRLILSFEKGFFFTIRELVTNPGRSIQDFLIEDRNRLVKPIVFLLITSLIYTLINSLFQFEDNYVSFSGENESATLLIFKWIQANYGYANIIMAFFIAGWVKLFFRKHQSNIFEILVLLCFVMGMGMLIFSIFGAFQGLTHIDLLQIAAIIGLAYLTWSIGQFYGKGSIVNYIKAFFAYILGMITFSLTAIIIGSIIDLLL